MSYCTCIQCDQFCLGTLAPILDSCLVSDVSSLLVVEGARWRCSGSIPYRISSDDVGVLLSTGAIMRRPSLLIEERLEFLSLGCCVPYVTLGLNTDLYSHSIYLGFGPQVWEDPEKGLFMVGRDP